MEQEPAYLSAFETFIADQAARSGADPDYRGSDEQLCAFQNLVDVLEAGITVQQGDGTYAEPGTIFVRWPPAPGRSAASLAQSLLHEVLHVRHSFTPESLKAWDTVRAYKASASPACRRVCGDVYQWFEDDRITRLGERDFPRLEPHFQAASAELCGSIPDIDASAPVLCRFLASTYRRVHCAGTLDAVDPDLEGIFAQVDHLIETARASESPAQRADAAVSIAESYASATS